jgi:AcrR family transcriptional regulator
MPTASAGSSSTSCAADPVSALPLSSGLPLAPRAIEHRPRTPRQRAVLDELEALILTEGFSHLRMTALASRLKVSATTLYALAARKDDLVMLVLDRWYQRTGREAMDEMASHGDPVARIEAWLLGAVRGSRRVTGAFLDDVAGHPAVRMLVEKYHRYYAAVLEQLLEEAQAAGALQGPSPRFTAQVVDAALTRFQDAHVLRSLGADESQAAEALRQLVMDGLRPRSERTT